MSSQSLIVYEGGGPLLLSPTSTWQDEVNLAFLTGLVLLLAFMLGTMVWCHCCSSRQVTKAQLTPIQKGSSSACSRTLPMSRYPKQGADLATFVTRRDSIWREHQLAGRDWVLVLD